MRVRFSIISLFRLALSCLFLLILKAAKVGVWIYRIHSKVEPQPTGRFQSYRRAHLFVHWLLPLGFVSLSTQVHMCPLCLIYSALIPYQVKSKVTSRSYAYTQTGPDVDYRDLVCFNGVFSYAVVATIVATIIIIKFPGYLSPSAGLKFAGIPSPC